MFAGEYSTLDFVATAVMLTLLCIAAVYDANGAEVPDVLTVPYAFLGITISVLHERWGAAVVALLMVFVVLTGWCPNWLKNLNAKLMARAYKTEEAVREETEQLSAKAVSFAQKSNTLMNVTLRMVAAFFLFGSVIGVLSLVEPGGQVRYIAAVVLSSLALYLLKKQTDRAAQAGVSDEAEPLSAFGGADIIIFAGILGFYGGIPFVYVMAATMVGVFILALAVKVVKRKKGTIGIPMLPGILVLAPIRLYILVMYCPRILQAFGWAAENMNILVS